jgi:hypothetical protein
MKAKKPTAKTKPATKKPMPPKMEGKGAAEMMMKFGGTSGKKKG